jgi:LacI family transcriptional regulator
MSVTQKQIAQEVGVSQQLVARALNNHPKVGPETRRKILVTAERLGYHNGMNRNARSMAARRHGNRVKTGIIAVILERMPADAEGDTSENYTYLMRMIDGVEAEAARREIDLFLVPARTAGAPRLILEGGVDGVILLGAHNQLYGIDHTILPVLMLGTEYEDIPALVPDYGDGMRQVTQHLIDLGHRHFAYVGPRRWPSAEERLAAFRETVTANGLEVDADLVYGVRARPMEITVTAVVKHFLEIRERHPFTALVCHSDYIAMIAIPLIEAAGLKVPEDISVTGFDDITIHSNFRPAVTSVAFPGLQMGKRAVAIIGDEVEQYSARSGTANGAGKTTPLSTLHGLERAVKFEARLIVRDSTTPPTGK